MKKKNILPLLTSGDSLSTNFSTSIVIKIVYRTFPKESTNNQKYSTLNNPNFIFELFERPKIGGIL